MTWHDADAAALLIVEAHDSGAGAWQSVVIVAWHDMCELLLFYKPSLQVGLQHAGRCRAPRPMSDRTTLLLQQSAFRLIYERRLSASQDASSVYLGRQA